MGNVVRLHALDGVEELRILALESEAAYWARDDGQTYVLLPRHVGCLSPAVPGGAWEMSRSGVEPAVAVEVVGFRRQGRAMERRCRRSPRRKIMAPVSIVLEGRKYWKGKSKDHLMGLFRFNVHRDLCASNDWSIWCS